MSLQQTPQQFHAFTVEPGLQFTVFHLLLFVAAQGGYHLVELLESQREFIGMGGVLVYCAHRGPR